MTMTESYIVALDSARYCGTHDQPAAASLWLVLAKSYRTRLYEGHSR